MYAEATTILKPIYLAQFEHVTLSSIDDSIQLVNLSYLLIHCRLLLLEHDGLPANDSLA